MPRIGLEVVAGRTSEMNGSTSKGKKVSNVTKATAGGGAVGVLLPYLANLASAKWGVPPEVAFVVVGGAAAWFGRWAAKLNPEG